MPPMKTNPPPAKPAPAPPSNTKAATIEKELQSLGIKSLEGQNDVAKIKNDIKMKKKENKELWREAKKEAKGRKKEYKLDVAAENLIIKQNKQSMKVLRNRIKELLGEIKATTKNDQNLQNTTNKIAKEEKKRLEVLAAKEAEEAKKHEITKVPGQDSNKKEDTLGKREREQEPSHEQKLAATQHLEEKLDSIHQVPRSSSQLLRNDSTQLVPDKEPDDGAGAAGPKQTDLVVLESAERSIDNITVPILDVVQSTHIESKSDEPPRQEISKLP